MPNKDHSEALDGVSDAYWQELLSHHPTYGSALGYREHDHRLPDLGPEARASHFRRLKELRDQLDQIPAEGLSHAEGVSWEILKANLDVEIAGEAHPQERWAVNPLYGTHVWLAELSQRQPSSSDEELGKLLSRYQGVPHLFAQERANLEEGIAHGQTAFRVSVERSIAQLERLLKIPEDQSSFIPPADRGGKPSAERQTQLEPLLAAIREEVYPALAAYHRFLTERYLPHARTTPGLSTIPGGDACYAYSVLAYTGIERSPQAVHEQGVEELGRIREEMSALAARAGAADLRSYATQLKARPDQRASTREDILEFNQALVQRAWEALPDWFSTLPQRPCEVRLIEPYREADSPAGYYDRAPDDGSRPAHYYVNGHDPQDRPLFNMEALAFHEAVPGHHLQIALAQELTDLPMFRRHLGDTAFIEGWALYTERLADEMGLYSSEAARFGMLSFQAWRACRLIIDTGLHALGWEREQAIEFLMENTAHSLTEATIEVDRYIGMPGQALAYMLGRMEIDGLRERARVAFGPRFDIKAFHDQVLGNGAVPLASLDRLIDRWISAEV